MLDYREVRAALRELHEPDEVAAVVGLFLSRLSREEGLLLPEHLRGGGLADAGMEGLAEAALELKREELRHRTGSQRMRTLEAAAAVLSAASARLAEITGPRTWHSMMRPPERGIAERRIARPPDA